MTNDITWPLPPADWPDRLPAGPASAGCIHIWAFSLVAPPDILEDLATPLSQSERDRAARFHFERHRNRFIGGRGVLRTILSRYLHTQPGSLQFDYGLQGKPRLVGGGLQFNLSHSEDLGLLAVCRNGRVGVDVERIRPLADAAELVERFFSPREHRRFQELSGERQPTAFFNLWTRKEALLKATGEGIAHSLRQVEVSFLPDEPAAFASLPAHFSRDADWELKALSPASGYAAALATDCPVTHLHCWRWGAGLEAQPSRSTR